MHFPLRLGQSPLIYKFQANFGEALVTLTEYDLL